MKIVKGIGPIKKTSRGTPDIRGAHYEAASSTMATTLWTRPLRYFLNQFKNCSETPYALRLARRIWWPKESKAFAKSKEIIPVCMLLSKI